MLQRGDFVKVQVNGVDRVGVVSAVYTKDVDPEWIHVNYIDSPVDGTFELKQLMCLPNAAVKLQ